MYFNILCVTGILCYAIMSAVPKTKNELKNEAVSSGMFPGFISSIKNIVWWPRKTLLAHIYKSTKINRSLNRASILLVGASGVGKSSTVNHLFDLDESQSVLFAKTSAVSSETRTTTEYILEMDSVEDYEATGLRLGLVDTPGFNDTSGTIQDACNFYSIKQFYEKHYESKVPNLVFVLIQANDTRIQGANSNLAKSLRCMKQMKLIDTRYPNVVAILTFCTALGESKQKFSRNIEPKMKIVRDTIFEFLEVNAPVVAIENDRTDLEVDGNYTVLPDGTRQVRNLYEACKEVFEKNEDEYAQIIFNAAFAPGNKKKLKGETVAATDVSKEPLSKEESEFLEFFKKAIEGEIADPIIQSARNFIKKEKLADEEAMCVQNVAGQLKKLGINKLEDLKDLSLKGLNLTMDVELTPTIEKYLKELGVADACFDLTADSAATVIGEGYHISTDSCVATRIFEVDPKPTKYGLMIPKIAEIRRIHSTWTFMNQYSSKKELVKDRLLHLNLDWDVSCSDLNFKHAAGFNLSSGQSSSVSNSSHTISCLIEVRLFELSMGNFRDKDSKLTEDFKADVDELPKTFEIENENSRKKI